MSARVGVSLARPLCVTRSGPAAVSHAGTRRARPVGILPLLTQPTQAASRSARRPPRACDSLSLWRVTRRRMAAIPQRTPRHPCVTQKKDMPTTTTTTFPRHLAVPSSSSPIPRPRMTPARTISLRTAKAGDDIMQAPQTPARDETHANDATSLTSSFVHTRATATATATTPHRHARAL